ncbi:PIG-L family deacetylase [Leifsonia sp. Root112D2]|uniref:PIG-L family deacetylase n=1 Tax=Leifsonia sp. Root112D2 TaxID=1736426 RepID=UPI0006FE79C2|nr:PIG-L family deacetylase [Leifsonia sp. Root112D2]KQV06727.1 hypothetical protein ASC63_04860 [Leifsonia sp. Root112D2]
MSLLHDARVVLLAHAHPDDETISTGALILELVERGMRVVLLTATRGEQGEVVPALRSAVEADEQSLERIRVRELDSAIERLGISEAYLLGAPPARAAGLPARRYEDSGMRWIRPGLAGPATDVATERAAYALSNAPLNEVVDDVRALIEFVRPDLVLSYDDNGGYGHPDHRRIRDAALRAATASTVTFAEFVSAEAPDLEWLELRRHLAGVQNALRSHATQLSVDGEHIVHSGGQREAITTSIGLRQVTQA